MAVIEGNGLKIEASVSGSNLTFKVIEQSDEATKTLKLLGHIRDDETGFSLRSNKRPSFKSNEEMKRFFVRGKLKKHDDRKVVAEFDSAEEAQTGLKALKRLVAKIEKPETVDPQHSGGQTVPGGTSHVRMSFINKAMATRLVLTGHKNYPVNILEWEPTEPIFTNNAHYNEHIRQAVDVLNKSLQEPKPTSRVINAHRATPEGAKKARDLMRSCFQYAYEDDFLVEFWRLATGLRGPDAVD